MGVAVLTSKINDSTAICRKLLEETLKPVSYTHLDVYKRQMLAGSPRLAASRTKPAAKDLLFA